MKKLFAQVDAHLGTQVDVAAFVGLSMYIQHSSE
jgi:hypothetical protein